MKNIDHLLQGKSAEAITSLYGKSIESHTLQIQNTRKDFAGDRTLVVFPLLKLSQKNPVETGKEIGEWLIQHVDEISEYNVVQGFLNLSMTDQFWIDMLSSIDQKKNFGHNKNNPQAQKIVIEYSSPNTNKPLHLGHIRNNLLGYSISEILKANGHDIVKVNLVNDRGIHICKSMLAWQLFGNGETPESSGKKGDHLVGDYYVRFDVEYKKQIEELKQKGRSEEDAKNEAPLILQAREMLQKWEAGDKDTVALWKKMNEWVYAGFDATYKQLGVDFDEINYESETYQSGKATVLKGLEQDVFYRKEDQSVWADLTGEGLDHKLLLRGDGTSVYMTQDIGTAKLRYDAHNMDSMIYVVGNEQNYHFQVLALILQKLGYEWAKNLFHLSYGMVELPEGKMKSREGTVVDADDLMEEMIETARKTSQELGKLEDYEEAEKERIYETIGLGALKYFILKVDPKKNMTFDPKESIDFNGNTGPFIQYTYARINSLLKKAKEKGIPEQATSASVSLNALELLLIKTLYEYPRTVKEAGKEMNPGTIANYIYELVKLYNQFYHENPILKHDEKDTILFRLQLSAITRRVISSGMQLLGIRVPERM
jgi:arginyl-tRNA synthetase